MIVDPLHTGATTCGTTPGSFAEPPVDQSSAASALPTVVTMDAELYVAGTGAAQGNTTDERYAVCKATRSTGDGGPAAGPESTYQVFLGPGLRGEMPDARA
jgi:hypothetical protein